MGRTKHILLSAAILFMGGCQPELEQPRKYDTNQLLEISRAEALTSRGTGAPALWKISDGNTDIFLFGTIHNLPAETNWRTDIFDAAFEQSNRLVLETDLTSELARQKLDDYQWDFGRLPSGQTLFEHLDVGDAYHLKSSIKQLGQDPDSLKYLQPWLAALRVSQMRMEQSGFNASLGVDMALENQAKTEGKSLHYLESLEDQMVIFKQTDIKEQIDSLMSLARDITDLQEGLQLIANEWLDGDVKGLGLLVANPELARSPESYDALIRDRNQKWAQQIDALFTKNQTIMVAVGAAHLVGPDSLIDMLDTQNRTMERLQ